MPGLRTLGRKDREIFLGRDFMREKHYTEDTARVIDHEFKHIIMETSYNKAVALLKKHKDKLKKLAEALLEKEVLDGEEVNLLLNGKRRKAAAPRAETPRPKADVSLAARFGRRGRIAAEVGVGIGAFGRRTPAGR